MKPIFIRFYEFALDIRDWFLPPKRILNEIQIAPGSTVLDFGCGPGNYALIVAPKVAPAGRVYALDIEPNMINRLNSRAKALGIANIETILSDCDTHLPDNSVDVALNFDMIHFVKEPSNILKEIHRVLKPTGVLAATDHHIKLDQLEQIFTNGGLFSAQSKGRYTVQFKKN